MRMPDSQRAGVGFGQSGQEDIGKVDEQGSNGLLGGVIKPTVDNKEIQNKRLGSAKGVTHRSFLVQNLRKARWPDGYIYFLLLFIFHSSHSYQ